MKKQFPITHWILLSLLLVLIAVGVIPSYLNGKWSWLQIPSVSNSQVLVQLRQTGLNLAEWQTIKQAEIFIGNVPKPEWSGQLIEQSDSSTATLFLKPQYYPRHKPEVEWSDIDSLQKWKTDSYTQLTFANSSKPDFSVTAKFFRAWRKQTYAVVQWYAWPGGGNFAPSRWFWLDQWAQLQGKRIPWVAVSILIPMNPSSELKTIEPSAKTLAQTVQTALEEQVFSRLKKKN